MNVNQQIAIISKIWLPAFGLKSLILEEVPLCSVYIFTDISDYKKACLTYKFSIVIAFEKNLGIASEQIPIEVDEVDIRSQILSLFRKNVDSERLPTPDHLLLTEREVEVLQLVTKGLLNKEVADKLEISIHTVISHRKNITSKLGIKTVSGLTIYAMMHKLI